MIECEICHAFVPPGKMPEHEAWHREITQRSELVNPGQRVDLGSTSSENPTRVQ